MEELTFRDFAGAIMGNDTARAAEVLGHLLGLDAEASLAAATHFQRSMAGDPTFMGKAMGLRGAVTGGSDEDIAALLRDCFGLTGEPDRDTPPPEPAQGNLRVIERLHERAEPGAMMSGFEHNEQIRAGD